MKNSHFEKLIKNFVPIESNIKRLQLAFKEGYNGFVNPYNAEHISNMGDLINMNTLRWIKVQMENHCIGKKILDEKPFITNESIQFFELKNLPKESLGFNYFLFMSKNQFEPNQRPLTKYIPDIELAYINQRYKEIHDFFHVLLGYEPNVLEEIAIKFFEALHLRLPSASLSSLVSSLTMSHLDRKKLFQVYLPHLSFNASNCEFLLNYLYEDNLQENIDKVRKDLRIIPLNNY